MRSLNSYKNLILPLREQLPVVNGWLKTRLDSILAEIMQREGFDMWLVIAREYNEDPVIMSLLPAPAMSARRRTILVFSLKDDGTLERLTLSRYGLGGYYESGWNPDNESQYDCLKRVITERNPQKIGINTSPTFAFGDGLSVNEYEQLKTALGDEWMARTTSAERLCIGWLERRIPDEMDSYPVLVELGHAIIAEAFSTSVIHPGITTTDDVVWWMRQTMHDLGLKAWFHPTIEIQAPGQSYKSSENPRKLIQPGDLLHCDMGFYYLGLATDQQQHAYVLKRGENDAPDYLKAALAEGNRLQDIHMEEMQIGRTGNEVLKSARERALAAGLSPSVYSHPLGYHGHAAGPTIGLWDQQGGVPGNGDYELFDDTCYSIELNITKTIAEWDNQEIRIALEEDALLTSGKMYWLHGRQTEFHLIG